MLRPLDKARHPALRMTTTSLLAKGDPSLHPLVQQTVFPFPGVDNLTVESMPPHTAIIGSSGSGKTILLKHFMSHILHAPVEQGGLKFRAVIYDPKRELYPFLHGLGIPPQQIIVAHPFDGRSACWNIAADFVEPAQIEELVEIIVPVDEKNAKDSSGSSLPTLQGLSFKTSSKDSANLGPRTGI